MRVDLHEDPAVLSMASALEIDELHVVGCLLRVWSWASSQFADGEICVTLVSRECHARSVTETHIDRCARVTGFARAMVDAGWLEETDDGYRIPGWDRWFSKSGKARLLAQRRQERRRENVTQMSRCARDKNVTREEKRIDNYPPNPPSEKGGTSSRQSRADKRRENFRRHAADIARLESLREEEGDA